MSLPPARIDRLNDVFDRAADLPPSERAAYLDAACAGDEAMRVEVEALLAAEADAGQFLADPSYDAAEVAARVIGSETTGSVINPYTLVRPLGDGGFGTVFLAEQSRPVRRSVALKIIKLGMDTRQVIARFEAERLALAMMEHPGIAKVYDAGATATGRPYFVMEYVDGVPNALKSTQPATAPASSTQPAIDPHYQQQIAEARAEALLRAGRFAEARREVERFAMDAAAADDATTRPTAPTTEPAAPVRPPAAEARLLLARAIAGETPGSAPIAVIEPVVAEIEAYCAGQPDDRPAIELLMHARRAEHEVFTAANRPEAAARVASEAVRLADRLLSDPDHADAQAVRKALAP